MMTTTTTQQNLNPRVTVILSSFNRYDSLVKSIKSVQNQEFTDWELIICDDASTDLRIKAHIDDLVQQEPNRYRAIHGEYKTPEQKRDEICTFSNLINDALDICRGEFICYLVDDVVFYPDKIKKQLAYLDRNYTTFGVWSQQDNIRINGNTHVKDIKSPKKNAIETYKGQALSERLKKSSFINHCSAMHRRTGLRWSENPAHWRCIDQQFWLRCASLGYRFDFNPEIVGECMFSDSSNIGPMLSAGKSIVDIVNERS